MMHAAPDLSPPQATAPDSTLLLWRTAELIAAGRAGAARPLLNALDRIAPGMTRTAMLRARVALLDGDPARACALAEAVVADAALPPAEEAASRKLLAEALVRLERPADAARAAADAVTLAPDDAEAKALLGTILLGLGAAAEAAACLAEAVRDAPAHPGLHEALAAALDALGDAEGAARAIAEGIALCPRARRLHVAGIRLALGRDDAEAALCLTNASVAAGLVDPTVFTLRGRALDVLGREGEAAAALAEAVKLAPSDAAVRHLAASFGVLPAEARAPADYVRARYDEAVAGYDVARIRGGYRVPGLVRRALNGMGAGTGTGIGRDGGGLLDLGCGTGLVGVAVSDLGLGPLVGVDVSPAMLAWARARGIYARLVEGALPEALERLDAGPFSVAVAADLAGGFGALAPLLRAIRAVLAPGGLLVISVETHPGEAAWRLARSGLYTHAPGAVPAAAAEAGFAVLDDVAETLRWEGEAPVEGRVLTLRRQDA